MDENGKTFVVGDVLWAKCGNHPYWPCMVSYDPFTAIYFEKKKVRSVETFIYHVQYFGRKAEHGWTSPGLILPFRGRAEYQEKRDALLESGPTVSAGQKAAEKYMVHGNVKDWLIAISEAETALQYEIEERFESFVFFFDTKIRKSVKKGTSKKKKNKKNSRKPQKAIVDYGGYYEPLCKICKKENVDMVCSGKCSQHFHKSCLGIITPPREFICIICEQDFPVCFVCKKAAAEHSFKCTKCEHHYHEKCLKNFACANIEKKICPYHVCFTCYNENPRNVSSKGSYVSCIRCPATFHATLHCIPVGSVKLKSSDILCPEHFLGKKRKSPQPNSNVGYCSVCAEVLYQSAESGGNQGEGSICCDSCPNSYHEKCINITHDPADDFFCEDCVSRQYLYVGMVVWAKTGHFRWWPAQIVNVDDLPLNVKNVTNYDGEFPIQYFGTDEYFWTHRGRVIPYADHHKDYCRTGSKQCRLDSYFKLSLEEASEAYDQCVSQRQLQNLYGQRDAYKHIKVNRAVPPAHITHVPHKKVLPCACNHLKPHPCSLNSECFNRLVLMECHPDICLAHGQCENLSFQRREYAKVKVIKTDQRGWGLQTLEFIAKGSFVIEYVGEVITHEEYRRRVVEMRNKNIQNYYFLYLDSHRMIDAGPQGNLSRFINHSCSPNCEMSKWSVNGDSRIGIFAIDNINPGQELTFNYMYDSAEFHQKCLCGSDNCQGLIGKKADQHKKFKSN